MKKYILFATMTLLLSSCSSIKLVGTYPTNNHFAETDLSVEQVWTRVIDYFAMSGISIKLIDKASGLIVSEETSFVDYYTREEDGKPIDPNAYVVIPTVRGGFGNILEPRAAITGEWKMLGSWNVRVKPNGDKTLVNINMTNLSCYYLQPSMWGASNATAIPIASTGVWENEFLKYLTK